MTGRRLRDGAVVAVGVVAMAVTVAPRGHAIDDCGIGMYFNNANGQCEPWAPVGVDFAPAVPVPVLDPVPLGIGFDPLPIGIGFDPGFGLNVPNIAPYLRVPGIGIPGVGNVGIPGVHVPGVGIPDVHVPNVGIPDVHVPNVGIPNVRVPDVRVPDVRVPEVHVPELHRR